MCGNVLKATQVKFDEILLIGISGYENKGWVAQISAYGVQVDSLQTVMFLLLKQ